MGGSGNVYIDDLEGLFIFLDEREIFGLTQHRLQILQTPSNTNVSVNYYYKMYLRITEL